MHSAMSCFISGISSYKNQSHALLHLLMSIKDQLGVGLVLQYLFPPLFENGLTNTFVQVPSLNSHQNGPCLQNIFVKRLV